MAQLIIVPTPIGNLEDITLRAVRILRESDLILAEDTRVSGRLLKHYDISTPMKPYHQFNEVKVTGPVISRLLSGEKIALITDAGTPGISDPGIILVKECIRNGIEVECLPGPTAFVPALVVSGLPCGSFTFFGFLPKKKGRKTFLSGLVGKEETMVFYESPYRLVKTLEDLAGQLGLQRRVSVSRELTKLYEETFRGTLEEAVHHFNKGTIKGEFVIVLEGFIP
ncbi:MAG: 16S rRNA (cytidine(1402)-2'-O)-methyltransferase [Bacteroidales bacterium]|nr:16S rRNA (cytidine(1402)-2'-O)-methyltransferase [Bacteroidales bacterium]